MAIHGSPILELTQIGATKPQSFSSSPFHHTSFLPHGTGMLCGSLQPYNLGLRRCWRMKLISPSPPMRREPADRQMKGVCAAPQPPTCYLNSPPDKVGSLSWRLPPSLPFMRLEILLPVKWRLEGEASKQERRKATRGEGDKTARNQTQQPHCQSDGSLSK